jgi:ABC-type Fe3+/spermidine/putrescine transport system ATPase subunit
MQGWARRDAEARAEELLDLVGLAGFGPRRVEEISGGEQQRVALARALAPRPRLLLLDEPLSALDRGMREGLRREIRRIQRGLGITTVYVTHDQEEALALSDRVVVMNAGRVAQQGEPREVYRRPASLFVAGFVGTSNQVPGQVVGREGPWLLVAGDCGLLRCAAPEGLAPGDAAVVVFRPESCRLGGAGGEGANRLSAVVDSVEYLGERSVLRARTSAGCELVVAAGEAGDEEMPAAGDVVSLAVPPAACWALRA